MVYINVLIVVLGLISSFQDITQKKVKNSLLLSCLAIYLFLVLIYGENYNAIQLIALNGLVATIVSIGLWISGIWPAGDTKLFALLAFMVPFQYYEKHYIPIFPSFVLLVNIFTVAVVFIFALMLKDLFISLPSAIRTMSFEKVLKYLFGNAVKDSLITFIKSLLVTIFVFSVARIITDILFAYGETVFRKFVSFSFLITFVLFRQVMNFIRKKISLTSCIFLMILGIGFRIVASGYQIEATGLYLWMVAKNALLFMGGMQTLMICSAFYFKRRHVYIVQTGELKKGMLLESQSIIKVQEKFKELHIRERFRPDGLDDSQIALIQERFARDEEMKICITFPFAPIIFVSLMLTMYTRDSVIHMVRGMLQ